MIATLRANNDKLRAQAVCPNPEYEAARATLEAREAAFEEARLRYGVEAIDDEEDVALDEAEVAQLAVFETTPSTLTGAAKFMRFVADVLDELGINDTTLEDVLTDKLRDAATVIESLQEPLRPM